MRARGRVVNYSVNAKYISIKVDLGKSSEELIDELRSYKEKKKLIRLDWLQIVGEINSILIRNTLGFMIHTGRVDFIARKLFPLVEKEFLDVAISDELEDKISYFLDVASKGSDEKRPDLFYKITSFQKNGKLVPGKKSVFDLSAAQKKVVLDKLNKLVNDGVSRNKPQEQNQ